MFQCYISKSTGKIFPMHSESLQCDVHVKAFVTARKRSLRRLCFCTCLSVILFTGGGLPQCILGYTPRSSACWEIRTTSGRYASYWNAVLLDSTFSGSILFVCRGYIFCGFKGLTGLIGRSKGGVRDAPLPGCPNSLNFIQLLGKFGQIVCWRPLPPGLAPPPRGNPGSATGVYLSTGGVCPIAYWDTPPRTRSRLSWGKNTPPPGRRPPLGRLSLGRHPLGRHPLHSACWDMVNKRAARIPLECILVIQ